MRWHGARRTWRRAPTSTCRAPMCRACCWSPSVSDRCREWDQPACWLWAGGMTGGRGRKPRRAPASARAPPLVCATSILEPCRIATPAGPACADTDQLLLQHDFLVMMWIKPAVVLRALRQGYATMFVGEPAAAAPCSCRSRFSQLTQAAFGSVKHALLLSSYSEPSAALGRCPVHTPPRPSRHRRGVHCQAAVGELHGVHRAGRGRWGLAVRNTS